MSSFQIFLTKHAEEDLGGIPQGHSEKIHRDLKQLESGPLPSRSHTKRLKGFRPALYRMRSGDFRILYRIKGKTVTILRVVDRKILQRAIKGLGI